MSVRFHSLKVAEVVPETAEANSIRFEIPAELRDEFVFKAGQHLTLRTTIDGEEIRRNYSLCTAPAEGDWMVTVKRIGGGLFSNWVGDRLKPGDTVEVMVPHGSFTTDFEASRRRHLVGIAGGSGITPVMSLIKTLLREEPNSRFTLLYGNRDSSSVIFLETLAGLKDKHLGRLEIYHFLDQEEQDIELFNGMLNRERLEEAITALVPDAPVVDGWFICGPGPMMDAAEAALLDRNIPKDESISSGSLPTGRRARWRVRWLSCRPRPRARLSRSRSTGGRAGCRSRRAISSTALVPQGFPRRSPARRGFARRAARRSPKGRSRWPSIMASPTRKSPTAMC